ncbi:MAG: helicase, partial [Bacteroidales bacterium]|nr:helicase [Bacteroidales bacterium]
SEMFPQNSERVAAQKKAPIRVIIGNPPYSVGQRSANDNAQNQPYLKLDKRISVTYAKETSAINKNSLYDSYIKAFRWASDRLEKENGGIICFVSNGAWIDGNSQDGFRKCLEREFSSIYVFNLRGNQRTSGELSRREGGKIFGSGSRTPISITLLVQNPEIKQEKATIHYYDIGDYLNREEKLSIVKDFHSVSNSEIKWKTIKPNKYGDWISQRKKAFESFIPIGDKDTKQRDVYFQPYYSNGLKTQRDAWCYNSSKNNLEQNIQKTLKFYNEQVNAYEKFKKSNSLKNAKTIIEYNSKKISWTCDLETDFEKCIKHRFNSGEIVYSLYRPFYKQYLYFSRILNERVYQLPKLFPDSETSNLIICISGLGGTKDSTSIITDSIIDLNCLDAGTQCFPLYYYEERSKQNMSLFDDNSDSKYIKRDGI